MKFALIGSGVALLVLVRALVVTPTPARQPSSTLAPTLNRAAADAEKYPYRSPQFNQFVADSYAAAGAGEPAAFYQWMEEAYQRGPVRYPGKESLTLEQLIEAKRQEFAALDPAQRAAAETELGGWLHKMVKKTIPRFSLDRGFEFTNVVRYGERQCFLQAVLIAGLLQAAGADAGVEMVSRNIAGTETNNGHAVALLKLPNGTDIIVDASDPEPFVRQQGLFVRAGSYRYVTPVYAEGSGVIHGYRAVSGGGEIPVSRVRTLDAAFIRSQFFFYRGERAPGGLLGQPPTPEGLEAEAGYLRQSVQLSPQNPLAVFTLGRTYLRQGKTAEGRAVIQEAYRTYTQAGWVPAGPREYLALVTKTATATAAKSATTR
jgi:hypothetical protein